MAVIRSGGFDKALAADGEAGQALIIGAGGGGGGSLQRGFHGTSDFIL